MILTNLIDDFFCLLKVELFEKESNEGSLAYPSSTAYHDIELSLPIDAVSHLVHYLAHIILYID
jgi:hypothetical protein